MRSILTIALKDLRLIWRDKFTLFWLIGFPVIYAVFFGSVLGGGGETARASADIALTDEDNTEFSQEFTAQLASSEAITLTIMTRDEGREAVRLGHQAAHVLLPEGFGESMGLGAGGSGGIELAIDPSRQAEAAFLEGMLMASSFQLMQERFMDPDRMLEQIPEWHDEVQADTEIASNERTALINLFGNLDSLMGSVIEVDTLSMEGSGEVFGGPSIQTVSVAHEYHGPRSAYEIMFPVSMLWGLIGCTAGFAVSLVKERTGGTYIRLLVSPLTRLHILGGKALACWLANLTVMVMLISLGGLGFGVRIANPVGLVVALVCTSVSFVGLMMQLSTLGKTEESVGQSAWAGLLVLGMVGGAMIPRFIMPGWLKVISDFSPIRWGIHVLEGATWRGFSMAELMPGCLILVGVGIGAFLLGVWKISRAEK